MGISKLKTSNSATAPLQLAREVLSIEAREVQALAERLDENFVNAVELILQCRGRVVVTGIGKSGHIGNKIAATLASTGTPAFFMHPAEASHGDLGMITRDDVVIALSNSGEADELLALLPPLKRIGAPIISISGNRHSTLSKAAAIFLDAQVSQEACPLGLAPTASTTAALALGDALAVTLLDQRGFSREDFALAHPGGSIGRRLLLHVQDIMRSGNDIPGIPSSSSLKDGLLEMSRKGLGMTAVLDAAGKPVGIFTDGDLRRAFEAGIDIHGTRMGDVMHEHPQVIAPEQLAVDAVALMEQYSISSLLVVDRQGNLVGALNMHDLLMAKVV
ncbi:KpsF/GutQ family sugar-phosphate isomerase [Methylobacillus flagellatus]|uniref:KpsF/GutQ family sugar-phosphate isomerase n=1 Tax=Methylobacillus flagellatus TaxID=405 RepID=UPI002853C1B5|nr:KpsF/GutQ family sugar-phosphate isomerase [Methylobacillus flagellatus]MDR5172856.1 KpsF/GutQ family sugar-phosphate isomerase [Methylobacillus flagellatus]